MKHYVAVLFFCGISANAETLLTWDVTGTRFNSGSGAASAFVVGVSGSAMSAGGTVGNPNYTDSWNRIYGISSTADVAQNNGNYISWTTKVNEGYTMTISGLTGLNLINYGPASSTYAELYFSNDGTNYTKLGGTFTATSTMNSAASTFGGSLLNSPLVIAGAIGGTTTTWRLVNFGGSYLTVGLGNSSSDDFSIQGTVIPEPSALSLLAIGLGGLAMIRRRRS